MWGVVIWWGMSFLGASLIAVLAAGVRDPDLRKALAALTAFGMASLIAVMLYRRRRLKTGGCM